MKDRERDTSLREAFVGILMTVGPFFGVRYQRPHVEVPTVSSPGAEDDSAQGLTTARAVNGRDGEDDGIRI
ncbi:MAG: hypothetical protein M3Z57_07985 [Candidatus Dormibacteraeota bacterium]|nr:hypothetical protein [Candidatus Dormibacteraeota bacterium]